MKKFVRIMLSASLVLILASVVFPGLSAGAFSHTINTPGICNPKYPPTCQNNHYYSYSFFDNPSNAGQINGEPNGYSSGSILCYTGISLQVTAQPATGYTFSYWSGSVSGSSNPTTLNVPCPGSPSITANYAMIPQVILARNYSSTTNYKTISTSWQTNNIQPGSANNQSFYETTGTYGGFAYTALTWTDDINNTKYVGLYWTEDVHSCTCFPSGYPDGNVSIMISMSPDPSDSSYAVVDASNVDFLPRAGISADTNLAGSYQLYFTANLYSQITSLSSVVYSSIVQNYLNSGNSTLATFAQMSDEMSYGLGQLGGFLSYSNSPQQFIDLGNIFVVSMSALVDNAYAASCTNATESVWSDLGLAVVFEVLFSFGTYRILQHITRFVTNFDLAYDLGDMYQYCLSGP
jgi:hypothetical protein